MGREREQAQLLTGWERAQVSHAQHLLVTGEAGIGKTRLVDELATRVRQQGGRVLRGRCWDVGGAPAYWPWIEALGSAIDELGPDRIAPLVADLDPGLVRLLPRLRQSMALPADHDEGGSEATRLRLFDATVVLLRRLGADRPVLVVLDDLESADPQSLQLLRYVVRARGTGALMVVAVYRSPVPPDAPAAPLLAAVGREPGLAVLDVGGLSADDIGTMMQSMTGGPTSPTVARALHERTGGNPLFASEFIRLISAEDPADLRDLAGTLAAAPLPAGVRGLITQRLAALPERCRELLRVAAVLGREFDLGTLARLTGESPDRLLPLLAPALATGVLGAIPERPLRQDFAHPLIRQGLYEGLAPATRAELHRQVGDALRIQFATALDDHLDAIASHYVAAQSVGAAPLALEYCRRAARRAASLAARDEAMRLFALAVAAAELGDDAQLTCDVMLELGEAQARAGRAEEAKSTFLAVAERAERLGRPGCLYLAGAALGVGGRFIWARAGQSSPEALLAERALASLPPEEKALQSRLLARLVAMDRDRRRLDQLRERSRRAVELGRASGDYQALAQALMGQVFIELWVDSAGALPIIDELERLSAGQGDLERELQARDYRVAALFDLGETAAAEAELATCLHLAERLAQPGQRWFLSVVRAELTLLRGELDRAEAAAWQARRLGRDAQPTESRMCEAIQLHAIRREQQRLAELAPAIDEAIGHLPANLVLRVLRVHLRLEVGERDEARAFLERQLETGFADIQDLVQYRYMLGLCAEMAEALGHRPAAAAIARLLDDVTQPFLVATVCVFGGSIRRYQALCAATEGRFVEAVNQLREAARENRDAGAGLCALRCDLDRARVLLAQAAAGGEGGVPASARQQGLALAAEVEREAARAGFTDLVARARSARGATPGESGAPAPAPAAAPEFRRVGEFWAIRWNDRALQVRDAKGMRYLAELLARPGEELPALELVGGGVAPEALPASIGGDLGPLLDDTARTAFKRRLTELAEEIEEADAWNDRARATRARHEQAALEQELAAAVGLGGRARPTGDLAEKARQSVTKAIKAATRRIAEEHEALGRHLDATIHTGLFCRYDPRLPAPPWRVDL